MRLTKQEISDLGKHTGHYFIYNKYGNKENNVYVNKLGQLEDIEEKTNGDLIKICLFALNGGYYKGESPFTIPTHIGCEDILVNFVFSQFYCYDGDLILYFKDYGKTWALTKEELL